MKNLLAALAMLLFLVGPWSCNYMPEGKKEDVGLANPACRHCVEMGYTLKPVINKKTGLVETYLCINPKSGKKCEAWSYFRNECKL